MVASAFHPSSEIVHHAPSALAPKLRLMLSVLHGAIGIAAIGGGAMLVAKPSGESLGLTTSMMSGFTSFLIPGALLIAFGALQLGAALWTSRPGSAGLVASQMGGGFLVLWIAFESALVKPIHPLQVVGLLLGALIFMIAHELHHEEPHTPLLP